MPLGHLVEQIRFQANAVISESQPEACLKMWEWYFNGVEIVRNQDWYWPVEVSTPGQLHAKSDH